MTHREIAYDLLLIIRGSKISRSETIDIRQIESWVNQYRAVLVRRALDKKENLDSKFIQTYSDTLESVDVSEINGSTFGTKILRTSTDIPLTIRGSYRDTLYYASPVYGTSYFITTKERALRQQYRPYSNNEIVVYKENSRLYFVNATELEYIVLGGIFSDPADLAGKTDRDGNNVYSYDDDYPMSMDMIPIVKDMILRLELNIMDKEDSDNANDGKQYTSTNQEEGKR